MESPHNIRKEYREYVQKIIQLNEEVVKIELKELARKGVEETPKELLDKEAEELTGAGRYEQTESRQGYRSGPYNRKLTITFGEVRLEVPKLKSIPFETALSNATAAAKVWWRKH